MKEFTIQFRTDKRLYDYIKFAAARSGMSISAWITMVLANIMIRDGEFFNHEDK